MTFLSAVDNPELMIGKAKRFCNLFLLLTRFLTDHESYVFSPQSAVSDSFVQCVWEVAFESKWVHALQCFT